MARAATPELAAAVSAAGGLGGLGSAMLPVDELRRQAARVRELTERPFQLNFFCHLRPEIAPAVAARAREYFAPLYDELGLGEPPEPSSPGVEFDDARLEALLELRPPIVSFIFGLPRPDALAAIREAGIRVLASATTVAEAEQLERRGVDAIVAQGAEAGGHRGSFLVEGDDGPVGTLALVP
jgi:nitronate monooxygenase